MNIIFHIDIHWLWQKLCKNRNKNTRIKYANCNVKKAQKRENFLFLVSPCLYVPW